MVPFLSRLKALLQSAAISIRFCKSGYCIFWKWCSKIVIKIGRNTYLSLFCCEPFSATPLSNRITPFVWGAGSPTENWAENVCLQSRVITTGVVRIFPPERGLLECISSGITTFYDVESIFLPFYDFRVAREGFIRETLRYRFSLGLTWKRGTIDTGAS